MTPKRPYRDHYVRPKTFRYIKLFNRHDVEGRTLVLTLKRPLGLRSMLRLGIALTRTFKFDLYHFTDRIENYQY